MYTIKLLPNIKGAKKEQEKYSSRQQPSINDLCISKKYTNITSAVLYIMQGTLTL